MTNRLTYKLNAEEQKEYRSRYIQFEYLPIPDYDIERGNYDRITPDMIYNKLGKLEDLLDQYNVKDLVELDKLLTMATSYEGLSKQIGCPLEVMFKALQNGIYTAGRKRRRYPTIEFNEATKKFFFAFGEYSNTEDYKKTWWLKADRSE